MGCQHVVNGLPENYLDYCIKQSKTSWQKHTKPQRIHERSINLTASICLLLWLDSDDTCMYFLFFPHCKIHSENDMTVEGKRKRHKWTLQMSWVFEFLVATNKKAAQLKAVFSPSKLAGRARRGSITHYSQTSSRLLRAQRTRWRLWKLSTSIRSDLFMFMGKSAQITSCSAYIHFERLHSPWTGYQSMNLSVKLAKTFCISAYAWPKTSSD